MPGPSSKPPPGRFAPTWDPDNPDDAPLPPSGSIDEVDDLPVRDPVDHVPEEPPRRYRAADGDGFIGQGGLGVVRAVWDEALQREVACKVLLGVAEGARADRFLREARATAGLQHPGIVPVHDVGRRPDGQLYYTMKYVRGRTLADAIAACRTAEDRLRLLGAFVDVCQAVAYAHSRGVLHRDLKPANVMVGEFGETVVLDWGLARVGAAADDSGSGAIISGPSHLTVEGAVMGTPAYMSPEQASGRLDVLDERADVWSLGVVLFELLAGRPPFAGEDTEAVLRAVRTGRAPRLREVAPAVPPELAAVVDKALSPEADARYPTARALAADVDAFRAGFRVAAYDYSTWELLGRFVARHRLPLTVGGAGLLALFALGIASYVRVVTERDRAQAAETLAVARERQAVEHLADALAEKALATATSDPYAAELYAAGALAKAERPEARGVLARVRRQWAPERTGARVADGPCRGLAWLPDGALACLTRTRLHVWDADGRLRFDRAFDDGPVRGDVAATPDGATLAVAQEGGRLLLLDARDGAARRVLETTDQTSLRAATFSADGARVFASAVNGPYDARLAAWDTATGAPVGEVPDVYVEGMTRGWDGSIWVSTRGFRGRPAGALQLDPATLAVLGHRVGAGQLLGVESDPAGRWVAGAAHDGTLGVWEPGADAPRRFGEQGGMGLLEASPDGRLLAQTRNDGALVLWEPSTWRQLLRLDRGTEGWAGVAFSPDGAVLALAEAGGVGLWTIGEVPGRTWLYGIEVESTVLQVLHDDRRVVASNHLAIVLWDIGGRLLRRFDGPTQSASVSPDGRTLVRSGPDGLEVLDVETGAGLGRLGTGRIVQAVHADHGRIVAGIDEAGAVVAYDAGTGAVRWRTQGDGYAWLHVGEEGPLLALGQEGHVVTLGATDGARREVVDGDGLFFATLSRDGRWIALQWLDGSASVVDTSTGAQSARFTPGGGLVRRARVSPDGRLVALGGADRAIRLWDREQGRVVAVLRGHQQSIQELAFTWDGRCLLSSAWGGQVYAWDLSDLQAPGAALLARAEARAHRRLQGVSIVEVGSGP